MSPIAIMFASVITLAMTPVTMASLDFSRQTLQWVIERFNAANPSVQIVIVDEEAKRVRLQGSLDIHNVTAFVGVLRRTCHVSVMERSGVTTYVISECDFHLHAKGRLT